MQISICLTSKLRMIAILLITLVPILTAADPAAAIEPSQTLYVLAAPFTTVTDTVESSALVFYKDRKNSSNPMNIYGGR